LGTSAVVGISRSPRPAPMMIALIALVSATGPAASPNYEWRD